MCPEDSPSHESTFCYHFTLRHPLIHFLSISKEQMDKIIEFVETLKKNRKTNLIKVHLHIIHPIQKLFEIDNVFT